MAEEEVAEQDDGCGFLAFHRLIRQARQPDNFKPPNIDKYEEKSDPNIWSRNYYSTMTSAGASHNVMANLFPKYLSQQCQLWLHKLPLNSSRSWPECQRAFMRNYKGASFRAPT